MVGSRATARRPARPAVTRGASITDELRRAIVGGEYGAGERLVESELCQRYGCGRAVVRAALLQLESEGLAVRQPNRGATVRRISVAEAIEITEARAALERLTAARAARRRSPAEADELRGILADMHDAVGGSDGGRYAELNRTLHRRLCEIGHHTVAADLVQNLRNRAVSQQYRLAMMPGRPAQSLAQHAAIVDAVVAGDEAAAADAMERHLSSVLDVLHHWNEQT